nr:MAG TPA: hypothetical protein [Caudoviricetes sp.]
MNMICNNHMVSDHLKAQHIRYSTIYDCSDSYAIIE